MKGGSLDKPLLLACKCLPFWANSLLSLYVLSFILIFISLFKMRVLFLELNTLLFAASLANISPPLQQREKIYLLAVGYYRSGEYSRSRQLVDQCLEVSWVCLHMCCFLFVFLIKDGEWRVWKLFEHVTNQNMYPSTILTLQNND